MVSVKQRTDVEMYARFARVFLHGTANGCSWPRVRAERKMLSGMLRRVNSREFRDNGEDHRVCMP